MKSDSRGTAEEWQQLRKDPRSAVVVLSVIVAGLAAMLALIGIMLGHSRVDDRSSPLYWALLLPFAWWAASLASYTPWAVRALRPAAAGFVLIALISLALALQREPNPMIWVIAAGVTLVGTISGVLLFSGSLVAQRGR